MKSLGLISQILTIGISVAIALMYIMPTFEEIGGIQTDIDAYKTQFEQVEKVNDDLDRLVSALASVRPEDRDRLALYMPTFVDEISVMRDLQFIVDRSAMVFKSVDYGELVETDDSTEFDELAPAGHQFTVVAEGTYSQVKDFFSLLEQNHYPLEVHNASIKPLEGGFMAVEATLVTYANEIVELELSN